MTALKDVKEAHASYEEAMRKRSALHDGLIEAGYRQGYVSTEESPGVGGIPMTTRRAEYRPIEKTKRYATMVQTFTNAKGAGETLLEFEKVPDNKLEAASPG